MARLITWRDLWGDPRDALCYRLRKQNRSGPISSLLGVFSDDFMDDVPGLACDDLEGLEWGT